MGSILVTGGAGYIGSHIVRMLVDHGRDVWILDDLSLGHPQAVNGVPLVRGDFGDPALLERELGRRGVEYVVHMAASCEVGQSMVDPAGYYRNNLTRGLSLLDAAVAHGVRGIVFSSTAAVYGEPERLPIDERHPTRPTNPYGETKLAFERALDWYGRAYGLRHVSLRYFNAAGAHPDGTIGEDHARETHLIPLLLRGLLHEGEPVSIWGDDYPTPDGTCVRDYVHVVDLAQAHRLALEAIEQDRTSAPVFNLGNGEGFSVREVVEAVRRVTGRPVPTRVGPRRPGDPGRLVASNRRAREQLGWAPELPTLDEIVATAWNWHRSRPHGYAGAERS